MRKPYQVLVFPYKKIEGEFKYAIFLREDLKVWQCMLEEVKVEKLL